MEERVALKNQFVNGKCRHRDPDEQHLGNTKSRGHPHLAKMKTKSGRDIEVRINVMHIMKAPEKTNAVICDVPPIKCQVHQKESCDELQRRWQREQMNQAERLLSRPAQGRGSKRTHEDRRHCKGRGRDD